ncbi:MAG: ATP-dependent helicase [Solirubrobacterales bacterium]
MEASAAVEALNPEQRLAVEYGEGPLLVIAGAGSGKTRVLTHRIAYLLDSGRARPSEILAITFTNRAADEMRERVSGLLGRTAAGMWVSTFHSACARMLRVDAQLLGYTRSFTIYDEGDSVRMVKRAMEELSLDPKELPPKAVKRRISGAKNELVGPEAFASSARAPFEEQIADIYGLYEQRMLESNAMDFDDLLVRTVQMLEQFDDVRERWRSTFRHVLVDEYQDTNHAQYRLLVQLVGERGNLTVVGDEDQSVYGFRNADIRNILDFEREFPQAGVVKLEQNYRSTQTILSAANEVVRRNRDRRPKELWTEEGEGEPVEVVGLGDEHEEARWVADRVEKLASLSEGGLDEVAVFYRTNAMSRVLEDTLVRYGLRYRVVGGTKFYDRAEVKDAVAYLQYLANPADSVAFTRIVNTPRRGIGKTSLGRILAHVNTVGEPIWDVASEPERIPGLGSAAVKALDAFQQTMAELRDRADSGSVAELIESVLRDTGYAEALEAERSVEAQGRLENLEELVSVAREFDLTESGDGATEASPLEAFLEQIALLTDREQDREEGETLSLMTLHNSKGLEFDSVIVLGCEEGLFPHARSLDEGGEEEERRLCYVGMTRARKRLVMTWALGRGFHGESGGPSRFLDEVPEELVERAEPDRPARALRSYGVPGLVRSEPAMTVQRPQPRDPGEIPAVSVGDDVEHESFGEGVVIGTEPGGLIVVRFASDGTERKLMAEYAPLVRRAG